MPRKPLIAGNWKMNKTTVQAAILAQDISNAFDERLDVLDVVLCPPFIDLKTVSTVLSYDKSPMQLGAQDVFWEESGAYTGEISPAMLAEVGCGFCIIGHSERREQFGETDEGVSRKARALVTRGIAPIICVGESEDVREQGDAVALAQVAAQLERSVEGLALGDIMKCAVAYEPIWAIGTGRTATPEVAQEMCANLRARLLVLYGSAAAEKVRILYGGSMKPENASFFAPQPDIDGGLIGGASLEARPFIDLAKAFL